MTSELPAPRRRPPLDDDLLLRVEIDRIASLGMEVAKEAVLPPGKREIRHRRRDADVDADVARARFVPELARGGAARREEARHVAVRRRVDDLDRLFHCLRA